MKIKYSKQIIIALSFFGVLALASYAKAGVPVTIVGDLMIVPFLERELNGKMMEFALRNTVLPATRNMILNDVMDSDLWVKNWDDFVWGGATRQNQQALNDFFDSYKTVDGLPANLAKIKLGLEKQLYGTGQKKISNPTEVGQEAAQNVFNAQKCAQNGSANCYDAFVKFIDNSDYAIANIAQDAGITAAAKAKELQQTIGTAGQGYLGKTKGSGTGAEIVTPAISIAQTVQRVVDSETERTLHADYCPEVLYIFGGVVSEMMFNEGMFSGTRSAASNAAMSALNSKASITACEFLSRFGL